MQLQKTTIRNKEMKTIVMAIFVCMTALSPVMLCAEPVDPEQKQLQEYREKAIKAIRLTALKAIIDITQIVDDGALASGFYMKDVEYMETEYTIRTRTVLAGPGQPGVIKERVPVRQVKKVRQERVSLGSVVFVAGIPNTLVDGELLATLLYPCGRYQYINTLGGQATVLRYATSLEIAADLIEADYRKTHKNEGNK